MPIAPSGALAGAAVSAGALAQIVLDLAAGLTVAPAIAVDVTRACRRVLKVDAPRVTSRADVAAIAAALVEAVQALARAAAPSDASAGLYAAAARARVAVPVSASPVLTRAYRYAGALSLSVAVACLGEAFLAECRSDFADRRAATAARTRITTACDGIFDPVADLLGQEVAEILGAAARQASAHLVTQAVSLAPVVRVATGRSFPSTALAWSLYGDPSRADELVSRNRIGTPLFCPATIEAVSPGGAA
ncbi:hypothetical protein OPKNFCMD_3834 [Methylobacterium crusticola]|uniref:Mu-like prophage DNA circulation protein n=1 Tax=Methylobacterium crusticola TaxID=1697972 RepID=A0ABQ4R087_9HYPH|nr:hypothetical protein [Methylobacterium crusticola]GJD51083.1 hypothetical protein OPKNFCMD_3834 [Methylobacterium crusticola]